MPDNHLVKLETKLSYQEDLLDELNSIINAEPKSYKDYPNDEKFLTLIYEIYRRFFKPQGTS